MPSWILWPEAEQDMQIPIETGNGVFLFFHLLLYINPKIIPVASFIMNIRTTIWACQQSNDYIIIGEYLKWLSQSWKDIQARGTNYILMVGYPQDSLTSWITNLVS